MVAYSSRVEAANCLCLQGALNGGKQRKVSRKRQRLL